jgi:hypothetical protein
MRTLLAIEERIVGVLLWLPLLVMLPIGFFRTLHTMPRYIHAARM